MRHYVIFGKPGCRFCIWAKNILEANNLPALYINIENNEEAKNFIVHHEKFTLVPQVYVVSSEDGMEHIGGYEDTIAHLSKSD